MKLNAQNYYSPEAANEWLSVSQYNSFVGTPAYSGCEARAYAEFIDTWKCETTKAQMIGSYIDAYFTEDLQQWIESLKPEDKSLIFTQKGELNASGKLCNKIIDRVKRDDYFMKFLAGERQHIVTGEIGGIKWRGKIDSLLPGVAIVDLKVVKSIHEASWCDGYGKLSYVSAGAYARQGAVYQYLHKQMTGHDLPFYHAAVSKEAGFDIEIIHFPDELLAEAIEEIKEKQQRVIDIKMGKIIPENCGKCEFCRSTKRLHKPISYFEV